MSELVDFDPYALGGPPHELFAELRAKCPVAHTTSGAWYLALHADVLAATKDVDAFVGNFREPGVVVPDDEKLVSEIEEPRHGRVRRVINSAIAYHKVRKSEPFVRELCDELIEPFVDSGGGDILTQFVAPIPSTVIALLIGVPVELRAQFATWGDEVVEGDYARYNRTERGEGLAGGHPEFCEYVDREIAWRRARLDSGEEVPDDLVTRLITGEIEGQSLTDVEIRTQLVNLLIAGNETTRHLLGNIVVRLAHSPELFAAVKGDRVLLDALIEESLRLDPPVHLLMRNCEADTELAGHRFAPGDKLVFGIASANRDEAVFDAPDQCRLDRPNLTSHLAFGAGPHVCPGASLARMEARLAIDVLLDKVSSMALAESSEPSPVDVFWANGWKSIPVTITA